jgi:hypothetical protein
MQRPPGAHQLPRKRTTLAEKVNTQCLRAAAGKTEQDRYPPVFPFVLEGPLMPRPDDKALTASILRKTRQALRVSAKELAEYLGESLRTVQKWEQAKCSMDPATWTLLQLAVRLPEVRRILALPKPERDAQKA